MSKDEKKSLLGNIVKFLIGVFFLILSFAYLQKNPAEKIALYSGFQIIVQKLEVFSRNMLGKNGTLIEEKHKLESDFLELIHLAEEKGCYNAEFLDGLHENYEALLDEGKKDINLYLPEYRSKMYNYYNTLSKVCEE